MPHLTTKGWILTVELDERSDHSRVVIYAASPSGPLRISARFNPYFYVAQSPSLPDRATEVCGRLGEQPLTALDGATVFKIEFDSTDGAERARHNFRQRGVQMFESDVRPRERFLMDARIFGGIAVAGECVQSNGVLQFEDPEISPDSTHPRLRVCSLDIETSISTGQILSIAAHVTGNGPKHQRVFMITEQGAVEDTRFTSVPDERALLLRFLTWFRQIDPDLIIGWNVIGFDLAFLQKRANALRLPFAMGRDERPYRIVDSVGRFSRVTMAGRTVLDGPQLLRNSFFTFDSYSLENVSRKVLRDGKRIAPTANRAQEIERLFHHDKGALAEYNLKDTTLVTRIFEELHLIDLTVKRTQLSGMLLDQVGLSSASFDHIYLPRLHDVGYVAPDVGSRAPTGGASGGHVFSPEAGIYENVFALDFLSLYPSIIRTFTIDPLSLACASSNPLTTPGGFTFSRTHSILPQLIGELMEERKRAKIAKKLELSQAIKILMNSFYGVMGSPSSRLYRPELPEAITTTGQWLLRESKKALEARGHRVIYGDTDSLFVQLGEKARGPADTVACAKRIAEDLTEWWRTRLKLESDLTSYLTLDFKKLYLTFLLPKARGGEGGAKKRYAGLVWSESGREVEFVGLEVVRSDWTKLAQEFQLELYTKVFHGEPIDEWIREYVRELKKGTFDSKLVYRKRMHKEPHEYGSSPPPYVRAALKLSKPHREVRYVITKDGPLPVELNPSRYDYEHYILHQLAPVADSLLEVMGRSFAEILSGQLKLF